MVIHVGDLFSGFLRRSVERSRTVGSVRLGKRVFLVEPVDRGRRSPDDSGLGVGLLGGDF